MWYGERGEPNVFQDLVCDSPQKMCSICFLNEAWRERACRVRVYIQTCRTAWVKACVCAAQDARLCCAPMCVDSLAHGPLSALSQPMCYMTACVAALNWIDTPAPLGEGYSGLSLRSRLRLCDTEQCPDVSPQRWFIVYWLFLLSENTDRMLYASSPPPFPSLVRLTSSPASFQDCPVFLSPPPQLCGPGCESRCPGWALVTRWVWARCMLCWLFSINLSRKNGSLGPGTVSGALSFTCHNERKAWRSQGGRDVCCDSGGGIVQKSSGVYMALQKCSHHFQFFSHRS